MLFDLFQYRHKPCIFHAVPYESRNILTLGLVLHNLTLVILTEFRRHELLERYYLCSA